MNETEIGNLIVRLVADVSDFKQSMKTSTETADNSAKKIEETTKKIEEMAATVKDYGKNATAALPDVSGFQESMKTCTEAVNNASKKIDENSKKIQEMSTSVKEYGKSAVEGLTIIAESRFFKDALEKFESVESSAIRLRAAIKANGEAVEETEARYLKFAKAQEKAGIYHKKVTLGLIQQAEALGVVGDSAEKAAKLSLALGALKGMDPNTFMRGAIALHRPHKSADDEDATQQIYRMLAGRGGGETDKKAQLETIMKAQKAGEGAMEELAKTSSVEMEKLGRTFNELKLGAGEALAKGIRPFVEVLKEMADTYKSLNPNIKGSVIVLGVAAGAVTILTSSYKLLNTVGLIPAITSTYAYFTATTQVVTQSKSLDAALGFVTAKEEKLGAVRRASAATMAGTVVAGAALAYGAYELSKAWVESTETMKNFNKTLEETSKLSEQVVGSISKRQNKVLDELRAMPEGGKEEYLKKQLKKAEQDLDGSRRSVEARKKEAEEYDPSIRARNLLEENNRKRVAKELEEAQKIVKSREEFLQKLHEEFAKVKSPEATTEAKKEATELNKSLMSQNEILYKTKTAYADLNDKSIDFFRSMQSEITKVYDLQSKHVPKEQLDFAIANIMQLYTQKGKMKLMEDLMDLDKELKKSINTFGASADAIKIWELETRMATQAGGMTDANKEFLDFLKGLQARRTELEKIEKIMDEGKATKTNNMTPTEKYEEQIRSLNEQVKNGAITYTTYGRAVNKAREELDKMSQSEQGIVGVLAGSKDAFLQQRAYFEMLNKKVEDLPVSPDQAGMQTSKRLFVTPPKLTDDTGLAVPGLYDEDISFKQARERKERRKLPIQDTLPPPQLSEPELKGTQRDAQPLLKVLEDIRNLLAKDDSKKPDVVIALPANIG